MAQITQPNQKISPTNSLPAQFLKVYRWASQNTAETRQDGNAKKAQPSAYKYFWPAPASLLLDSLKLSRGQLIALVGLSGVGKSSAQKEIAKSLDAFLGSNDQKGEGDSPASICRPIYFKWPGKFEANIPLIGVTLESGGIINRQEGFLLEIIRKANSDPLYDDRIRYIVSSLKGKTLDDLKQILDKKGYGLDAFIKKFLTKKEQKESERELVISTLSRCHSILIDMRDYGMEDKRTMASDLAEIQKLWQTIISRVTSDNMRNSSNLEVPNFVFVLQKELAMSEEGTVTHFFLGKTRVIEIFPFSPKELVHYYKKEFQRTYPFKDESTLTLLARFSRGIFRRFLRYIKLSLEIYIQNFSSKKKKNNAPASIDSAMITKTLDSEEILSDWKMDLERIFSTNPRQVEAASEIVMGLMESKSSISQSLLMKYLWKKKAYKLSAAEVSRILTKLEHYGYVRRNRKGNEKFVTINC